MVNEMLSLQEVYNIVAEHLLKQNASSENEIGSCMYRGVGGLKCAVGALIPNERYSIALEHNSIRSTRVLEALRPDVPVQQEECLCLLRRLQAMHDFHEPERWPVRLVAIAALHDLQPYPRPAEPKEENRNEA